MSASLTVTFDLTGTLTNHTSDFSAFMADRAEMTSSRVLSAGHSLFEVLRGVKRSFSDVPVIPPAFKKAVIDRISPLRPSAHDVLADIRARGARVVLLSNDPKGALGERVLRYNGLFDKFDSVVFPEDVHGFKKPDPSGLLRIISERQDPQGVVIMVGDKASDMQAADNAERASGVHVFRVAIGQDSSAAAYIREDGRGVVLNRLRELSDVVDAVSCSIS